MSDRRNEARAILAIFCTAIIAITILCCLAVWLPPSHTVNAQGGLGTKKYVNTATTTTIFDGVGFLDRVTVNGGTGGVVTLYDIGTAGCTGTPASGKFAAIASASAPVTLQYEFVIKLGLCVVTASATDLTVTYN